MDHSTYDIIDGRRLPPTVFTEDHVLTGNHRGSVRVDGGALELVGKVQGSLWLATGASVELRGTLEGSAHLASGSTVDVIRAIEGSVHVEPGARVVVESSGRIAGSLHNEGVVIVRGVFGGSRSGAGEFRLEDHGWVKQPRIEDGVPIYDW
jgi:hypothetical protein